MEGRERMTICLSDNGDTVREYIDVPEDIYRRFQAVSKATINVYFTAWAKRDWGISIPMITVKDLDKLKEVIARTSKRTYPELFVFPEIRIGINFWLSYWVTSHMSIEVERHEL